MFWHKLKKTPFSRLSSHKVVSYGLYWDSLIMKYVGYVTVASLENLGLIYFEFLLRTKRTRKLVKHPTEINDFITGYYKLIVTFPCQNCDFFLVTLLPATICVCLCYSRGTYKCHLMYKQAHTHISRQFEWIWNKTME